jgi:HTH-type transcriptional regulator / antitoxin HipB
LRLGSARDLGSYVRERRRKLDLTQAQLAARARVSRRWLSDLEAGKESADFGLVLRTLHALGLVLDAVPEEETAPIDLDAHLDRYLNRTQRRAGP